MSVSLGESVAGFGDRLFLGEYLGLSDCPGSQELELQRGCGRGLSSDGLDLADPIQMKVQDRKLLTDWVLPRINYGCCR